MDFTPKHKDSGRDETMNLEIEKSRYLDIEYVGRAKTVWEKRAELQIHRNNILKTRESQVRYKSEVT